MASGKFTASAHDQLVVGYYPKNDGPVFLKVFDFAPGSLQPQEKSTLQTASYPRSDGIIRVKTGKFNYPSELDQIVSLFGWRGSRDPGPGG